MLVGAAITAAVSIITLIDSSVIIGGGYMAAVLNLMAAGASGRRAVGYVRLARLAPCGNAPSPANFQYIT